MAGTSVRVTRQSLATKRDELYQTRVQLNKLVDDVELLRAAVMKLAQKLDADAGVTDTNYAAQTEVAAVDAAAHLLAAKVI